MATTIYATFATERDAERAAGALMDHGISSADVSFIVPEQPVHTEYAGGLIPTGPDASTPANAPASHYSAPADLPVPDPATPLAPSVPSVSTARPGALGQDPVDVQPRPGYIYNAVGEEVPNPNAAPLLDTAGTVPVIPATAPIGVAPAAPLVGTGRPVAADAPSDVIETDYGHIIDNNREEPAAARGITTTTGKDAARGAAEGAGIGLGLGLVLGVATLAIPGIGLVAGAGALVAGLMAATAAAGGVAGAAYGFLADLGLPPHTVRLLENHLQSGGIVLSINMTGAVPQDEIVMLLEKYGATSAQAF